MKNNKKKVALIGVFVTSQILLGAGCNSTDFGSKTSGTASNATATANSLASSVSLTVFNPDGTTAYSDGSNSGSTLKMTVGSIYNFHVDSNNLASGATLTLQMQDTDVVNGAITSKALNIGNNSVTGPSPGGNYAMTLQVASGGVTQAKHYQSAVGCTSAFSRASLSPNAITATYDGSNNLFDFSAAGVIAHADGTGPYLCGFDMTGVGIVDSAYVDCATGSLKNQYVNLVGNRNIGVVVKDSCNVSYSVSANPAIDMQYTVPTGGTEVTYIYGTVAATGAAATDPRIGGVTYLSTNNAASKPVQSTYSDGKGAAGAGVFTIGSAFNFGSGNSLPYGMTLKITGLTGAVNAAAQTGTIDATGATVSSGTYSTDQSGDQAPATSMAGNCTGTVQAKTLPAMGQPCSGGTTGDQNSITIEVWGTYTCQMAGAEGTATITGSYDGLDLIADSCVGGGQGGGGVPPVTF